MSEEMGKTHQVSVVQVEFMGLRGWGERFLTLSYSIDCFVDSLPCSCMSIEALGKVWVLRNSIIQLIQGLTPTVLPSADTIVTARKGTADCKCFSNTTLGERQRL